MSFLNKVRRFLAFQPPEPQIDLRICSRNPEIPFAEEVKCSVDDFTFTKGNHDLKRILVIYVGVGHMPSCAAEAYLGRQKAKYQKLFERLPDHVGVMFVITRVHETRIEIFNIEENDYGSN